MVTAKQLFTDDAILWCLSGLVLSGGFFLFMTVWRARYLKFVEREHRFIKRLGIPDHIFSSTKRMEESRGYVITFGLLALLSLTAFITRIVLHIHYGAFWPQ
jgi:hypothetical protein